MTGSATQSGQDTSQPAGGSGAAAAAGDPAKTLLGGEAQAAAAPAKPADGQAPAAGADGAAKPDGQVKADDAAKAGETKPDDKATKAPEKYADFKMPDGVTLNAKALESFTPAMRELNLSQDQAQKLVDVYAKQTASESAAFFEQLKDDGFALEQVSSVLTHQRESWGKALKDDAEIGGKNFDANAQTAQRAIARFGSPQLKTLLETSGLGNHPEIVRFCLKVGRLISEDATQLANAGAGGGARKASEAVFYGGKSG